ncbi:MAG: InlB B-repeat-containing protein, partial [Eubacterium sp.]
KRVKYDGSEVYIDPSPTHQYNLENEADYFDGDGNAMKDGTVSAAIRAMGSGLFENNSDRAVTTEPITLTIQSLYHPVKFDPNGTGVNQMPESQEILRGRLLTKPEAEPQRAGYTFLKWSTDPEGQVAWNFDSDTMPDEAITLYATWEAIPESSDLSTSNTVNTGIPGRNEQMVLALGTVLMSLLGALGILKISSSFHKR